MYLAVHVIKISTIQVDSYFSPVWWFVHVIFIRSCFKMCHMLGCFYEDMEAKIENWECRWCAQTETVIVLYAHKLSSTQSSSHTHNLSHEFFLYHSAIMSGGNWLQPPGFCPAPWNPNSWMIGYSDCQPLVGYLPNVSSLFWSIAHLDFKWLMNLVLVGSKDTSIIILKAYCIRGHGYRSFKKFIFSLFQFFVFISRRPGLLLAEFGCFLCGWHDCFVFRMVNFVLSLTSTNIGPLSMTALVNVSRRIINLFVMYM